MHAYSPILAPVVALVAWTLIVMIWMMISRGSEFRRLGITATNIPDGARGVDLEGKAAASAQWKSHNYNHLMEQPTIFYAIALTLALMDFGGGINYWLAWGYVGLRMVHTLVQTTVNVVMIRFYLFVASTLVLAAIVVRDTIALMH